MPLTQVSKELDLHNFNECNACIAPIPGSNIHVVHLHFPANFSGKASCPGEEDL